MFDMIGNILKNILIKPATRDYPVKKRINFKDTRGSISGIDINDCVFCGLCKKVCPSEAIDVDRIKKTWELDPFKCIICGECFDVCPKKCINLSEDYEKVTDVKQKMKFTKIVHFQKAQ